MRTNSTLSLTLLVWAAVLSMAMMGCAGGKGFRLEIGGSDPNQKVRSAAVDESAAYSPDVTRLKELPEMTADEQEQIGDAMMDKGNLFLAYVHYNKSLKLKPDNMRVEYKKGFALLMAEKSEEAIAQFTSIVGRNPQFAMAYEGLGWAHFQKKDYMPAEHNFKRALALDHRLWRSYNYLGNIYDHRRDHPLAILEYTSAISVRPDVGFLYHNLGVSYLLAGQNEKAVVAFTQALERNHREPKLFNNLGLALANLGRFDEAFVAFKSGGGEAQAFNNLGCIYLDKGDYSEAVKSFEKAIALEPGFYAKAADNLKKAKEMAGRQ